MDAINVSFIASVAHDLIVLWTLGDVYVFLPRAALRVCNRCLFIAARTTKAGSEFICHHFPLARPICKVFCNYLPSSLGALSICVSRAFLWIGLQYFPAFTIVAAVVAGVLCCGLHSVLKQQQKKEFGHAMALLEVYTEMQQQRDTHAQE